MKLTMELHNSSVVTATLAQKNFFIVSVIDCENAWADHLCRFGALPGRAVPDGWPGCTELHNFMEDLPYSSLGPNFHDIPIWEPCHETNWDVMKVWSETSLTVVPI